MITNPPVGVGQPFRGQQLVVLERRDSEGRLCFEDPQPPFGAMYFDELYDLFFRSDSKGEGSWESLRAWLEQKSWTVRACTWQSAPEPSGSKAIRSW